jgi:hypothetical protein
MRYVSSHSPHHCAFKESRPVGTYEAVRTKHRIGEDLRDWS